MGKEKAKRDRSLMPFTAAWMAKMKPAWDAYRAKRDRVKKVKGEIKDRPANPVRISLACVHIGDDLTAAEVERHGLDRRRSWHRCEIGMAKNKLGIPGVACSCEGCNGKCEGYKSPGEPK